MSQFKRDVIFDETINNRRFIVTRNGFDLSPEERKLFVDLARDWYCGYMEIKTADEEYKYFKSDDSVDENDVLTYLGNGIWDVRQEKKDE